MIILACNSKVLCIYVDKWICKILYRHIHKIIQSRTLIHVIAKYSVCRSKTLCITEKLTVNISNCIKDDVMLLWLEDYSSYINRNWFTSDTLCLIHVRRTNPSVGYDAPCWWDGSEAALYERRTHFRCTYSRVLY